MDARDGILGLEVVAFENIQRIDERDATRRRRRSRNDARALVRAHDRGALDGGVVGEILLGPDAAELANAFGELLRERAFVEALRAFRCEQLERRGEIGRLIT